MQRERIIKNAALFWDPLVFTKREENRSKNEQQAKKGCGYQNRKEKHCECIIDEKAIPFSFTNMKRLDLNKTITCRFINYNLSGSVFLVLAQGWRK